MHRAVDPAAWAVTGMASAVVRQTIASTAAVRRFRDFDIVMPSPLASLPVSLSNL
jgi:hypothetical protein